ncbi:MAG: sortase-associated OmpA-like protein PdsO [Paraglaciecola sp.]|uniref:sortase-associated OmpA-like protein PdsO n=1 Tax=Paraglaciecola sp. TaxID=1920173 RepID=UPI0032978C8E
MKFKTIKIATSITFICLMSSNAAAEQSNTQEKTNEVIGLSSGVLIGSALAGPLGGMVAGIFGVLIAEDINSDKKLEAANDLLQQKDQQLFVMQQNFEQAKERTMMQIASMDNALEQSVPKIESNIQFKTASYVLENHYKSQLDLIAQTLQNNPKLRVSLSGFADKRGDSTFNQALSEQRALSVKHYLIKKGIKEEQVITYSFGESSLVSAGEYFEDDFFDRRVMLRISDDPTEMTAANQ